MRWWRKESWPNAPDAISEAEREAAQESIRLSRVKAGLLDVRKVYNPLAPDDIKYVFGLPASVAGQAAAKAAFLSHMHDELEAPFEVAELTTEELAARCTAVATELGRLGNRGWHRAQERQTQYPRWQAPEE